jgi:hypothetical protein
MGGANGHVSLAARRHVEKIDHSGFQRILSADDEESIPLDQLLEDFRSVSQMVR